MGVYTIVRDSLSIRGHLVPFKIWKLKQSTPKCWQISLPCIYLALLYVCVCLSTTAPSALRPRTVSVCPCDPLWLSPLSLKDKNPSPNLLAEAGREWEIGSVRARVPHLPHDGAWFVFKLCNQRNLLIECSVRRSMTLQASTSLFYASLFSNLSKKF